MRFIIPLWVNEGMDADSFDAYNPLSVIGEMAQRRGWELPFTIFFADGARRLSPDYLKRLRGLGFEVVDHSDRMEAVVRRYGPLNRFVRNEMMCFVRWAALKEFLDAENYRSPFVVVDSDIVYNAAPAEIFRAVAGRTMITQGNPCFTVISDHGWLDQYLGELDRFCSDIDGYSAEAWAFRQGLSPEEWKRGSRERWYGGWWRQTLSSDQDLIAYLVRAGRLRQDDPASLARESNLYFAENPLNLTSHAVLQLGRDKGLPFTSDGQCGYLDGRKVAFWHFQNGLRTWLNLLLVLRRFGWKGRVPMHDVSRFAYWMGHLNRYILHMDRRTVIQHVSEFGYGLPDSVSLADIFNGRTYWKPGALA